MPGRRAVPRLALRAALLRVLPSRPRFGAQLEHVRGVRGWDVRERGRVCPQGGGELRDLQRAGGHGPHTGSQQSHRRPSLVAPKCPILHGNVVLLPPPKAGRRLRVRASISMREPRTTTQRHSLSTVGTNSWLSCGVRGVVRAVRRAAPALRLDAGDEPLDVPIYVPLRRHARRRWRLPPVLRRGVPRGLWPPYVAAVPGVRACAAAGRLRGLPTACPLDTMQSYGILTLGTGGSPNGRLHVGVPPPAGALVARARVYVDLQRGIRPRRRRLRPLRSVAVRRGAAVRPQHVPAVGVLRGVPGAANGRSAQHHRARHVHLRVCRGVGGRRGLAAAVRAVCWRCLPLRYSPSQVPRHGVTIANRCNRAACGVLGSQHLRGLRGERAACGSGGCAIQ